MSERYIMKKNEIKNVIKKSNKEAEIKNKAEQINNKPQNKRKNLQLWGCQYGEYWHTS